MGFYKINTDRINEIEDLMENSLYTFIENSADGVSTGYFEWDDMYEAIINEDLDFIDNYERDITSTFALSGALTLIDKSFDGSYSYSIYSQNGISYVEIGIFDSFAEKFLTDKMVRIAFSPMAIFEESMDNSSFNFGVKIVDSDTIEGIQVINNEEPLNFFHYISAISIALFSVLIIQTFYQFSIQSHYEIEGLANIVMLLSKKDTYTAEHSKGVAELAVLIASKLGMRKNQQKLLNKAGHLHDIGKIGISESILNKSGKLLPEEYEEIKKHSLIGYEIVSQFPNLKEVALIVKHHHEMMDGSGYPDGLKGDEIPFNAQILNVADIFNALTTDRPYRKGFEQDIALEMMTQMPLNQDLVAILKDHFS
jgi:putative nucleotidyltransferase with HDIG domain